MRRMLVLLSLMLAAAFAMLAAGTAEADGGPHEGDFTSTTDACAGCHRVHRGQAPDLLTETSQQALCYSCHGTAATGADTNVEDGVYELRGSGGIYGSVGDGLRGGGFAAALMDPGMTGIGSALVTSKHDVGASGTIWGNGAIDSGPGTAVATLECGSCHNPHGISGGDNYRILRPRPKNSGAGADVNVPDEGTKNYTITYQASGYRDTSYLAAADISSWCSQCHTRYLSNDTGDSGDAIFAYRHRTDNKSCLNCHVAHGTSATMATFSGAVEWPDGTAGGGNSDSRLLSVNNRGTCVQCHPSP
ncbi:MAG: cytochrome c3 family protein [Anaerolineales bacterium]